MNHNRIYEIIDITTLIQETDTPSFEPKVAYVYRDKTYYFGATTRDVHVFSLGLNILSTMNIETRMLTRVEMLHALPLLQGIDHLQQLERSAKQHRYQLAQYEETIHDLEEQYAQFRTQAGTLQSLLDAADTSSLRSIALPENPDAFTAFIIQSDAIPYTDSTGKDYEFGPFEWRFYLHDNRTLGCTPALEKQQFHPLWHPSEYHDTVAHCSDLEFFQDISDLWYQREFQAFFEAFDQLIHTFPENENEIHRLRCANPHCSTYTFDPREFRKCQRCKESFCSACMGIHEDEPVCHKCEEYYQKMADLKAAGIFKADGTNAPLYVAQPFNLDTLKSAWESIFNDGSPTGIWE